jgi:hypothetical protein
VDDAEFTWGRGFVHHAKQGSTKVSNELKKVVRGERPSVTTSSNLFNNVVGNDLGAGTSRKVVGVYGGRSKGGLYTNVEESHCPRAHA